MAINWPTAVVSIVAAIPAIIAAWFSHANRASLKTGNGKTVGDMVTEIHGEASDQATPYDTHHGRK